MSARVLEVPHKWLFERIADGSIQCNSEPWYGEYFVSMVVLETGFIYLWHLKDERSAFRFVKNLLFQDWLSGTTDCVY